MVSLPDWQVQIGSFRIVEIDDDFCGIIQNDNIFFSAKEAVAWIKNNKPFIKIPLSIKYFNDSKSLTESLLRNIITSNDWSRLKRIQCLK